MKESFKFPIHLYKPFKVRHNNGEDQKCFAITAEVGATAGETHCCVISAIANQSWLNTEPTGLRQDLCDGIYWLFIKKMALNSSADIQNMEEIHQMCVVFLREDCYTLHIKQPTTSRCECLIYTLYQGRAETFGGAGAQSLKGTHGTRLLIGLCPLLICVSKWMLLYRYSSTCHDAGLKKKHRTEKTILSLNVKDLFYTS